MTTTVCTVNLNEEYEVTRFFRDLFNLSSLLKRGLNKEMLLFIRQLKVHGWGEKQIHEFITKAGSYTNYEYAEDSRGNRVVPRAIPEKGDRWEYLRNRFRLSK